MIQAQFDKTFEGWRKKAREFILEGIPPAQINWSQDELSLFTIETAFEKVPLKTELKVPPDFIHMMENVSYARDENRWNLMYRILFRLVHENPNLLKIPVDPDIREAELLEKSVRKDIHKMHAFVRFKKSEIDGEEVYIAWHRPEHFTVRPGTPFFARRFGDKRWSIFTPDESAHWDLKELTFGPGMEQKDFHTTDNWDELWKSYYKSIFNPARIKIKMMKSEMSPKYWSSMPETSLIAELVREAPKTLQKMAENINTIAVVDNKLSLTELKEKSSSCTACPLYKNATQTVFGVGPENAKIMIVGEQPGDQEDLTGKPFIGPAGELLAQALVQAGINKDSLYITNAVKHFKWIPRGNMRFHQKPSGPEMHACKPWLEAEIRKVKPDVIIALGATAATAIIGKLPKIKDERGKFITNLASASNVIISWHPSAILRSLNDAEQTERYKQLVADLKLAAYTVSEEMRSHEFNERHPQ